MNIDELNSIFGNAEDLFNRDSAEYKEAYNFNKIERSNLEKQDDPLTVALGEAAHLDDVKRAKYVKLAGLYLEDMHKHIFMNQFELNKKFPNYSVDEWNDFLTDRIVNVYINKHKRTLLKAAAEDNLSNPIAKNKRDNLQLIKNIEEQEQSEQNKNICIIRIPNIYDDEDE